MAKKIKLGIIGMSEGNGHPYSWSAIFNGYNQQFMKDCPFPAIPEYLDKQKFPEDSLSDLGLVTHIWTQDKEVSNHIAASAKIENVVENLDDMIGEVDAILLARDDAENHYQMALPFLKAGLPVFIDKPLALSRTETSKLFEAQKYEDQIFTCSSLRYAEELQLTEEDRATTGQILHVEASVPKKWDTYAVHIIEPLIAQLPERGALINVSPFVKNGFYNVMLEWENMSGYLKVTGNIPVPVKFEFFGENGNIQKFFKDSFACFRASLEKFTKIINKEQGNISKQETLEVINIIERGRE